jgi:choline transport protein
LRNQPLLPRRWSLGKWGGPVNDVALAFLIVSFVMSFFPTSPNPDAADMNWAIVIFVVVVVAAMVNYYVNAHRHYIPPVCLVKND